MHIHLMSKLVVGLLIISGASFYTTPHILEKSNTIPYNLTHERELNDGGEFYLHKIIGSSFFVATDKILEGNTTKLVSRDNFWNPRFCAQMETLVAGDRIYFFDTYHSPNEEVKLEAIMHVYDLNKNYLKSFTLADYRNWLRIFLVDENIYLATSEGREVLFYKLNLEDFSVGYACSNIDTKCADISNVYAGGRVFPDYIIEQQKPYELNIFDKKIGKNILDLDRSRLTEFFLLK